MPSQSSDTQPHCPSCRTPLTGDAIVALTAKVETLEEYILDVRNMLEDVLRDLGVEEEYEVDEAS